MELQPATIKITLTDFVNFILGNQNKATLVHSIIQRKNNSFFLGDYYLPLQQSIIAYHQQNRTSTTLWAAITKLSPGRLQYNSQVANYHQLLTAYLRLDLCKTKTCTWFAPPKGFFSHKNLVVTINPELGLQYKRQGDKVLKNYIIKLYYKKEVLTKQKANLAIALMEQSLSYCKEIPTEYCILDLRRATIFYKDKRIKNSNLVVLGEAESFLSIWNNSNKSSFA